MSTTKKLSQKNHTIFVTIVTAGATAAILYTLLQSSSAVISSQFSDEKTTQQWHVQGQAETKLTPDGLLIKPQGTVLLISPRAQKPRGSALSWSDFPYIKLRVKPEEKERRMALVWITRRDSSKSYQLPFKVPAAMSKITLDVRQDMPWQRYFGWDNSAYARVPISHIGILLQSTVEFEQFEWVAELNLAELAHLLWN